jgi:hypothetical protein
MTRVEKLSASLLAIAVALLLLSFSLKGLWQWAFVFILSGLLWWFRERQRGWHWVPSIGIVVFTVFAAAGYWLGISLLVMMAVVILALSAWDLDAFAERLAQSYPDNSTNVLVQNHLRRLVIVNAAALALAAFSLTVELRFNFVVALLLGLFMAFGLNRLLVNLGKNNQ